MSRTPTPWCRVSLHHSWGAGGRVVMELFGVDEAVPPPGVESAEVEEEERKDVGEEEEGMVE